MNDSDSLRAPPPVPTASRPLLGLTVLAVEDSRFASEALRLLCLRSGARIRRADSLRAARRHLQVYRPTAVIVDLGLPDGSGTDLIAELHRATPRVGIVLGASADPAGEDRALAAGADGYLAKPVTALAAFQSTILSRLPIERRPARLRAVTEEHVAPDPLALQDDLAQIAGRLEGAAPEEIGYIAQFLGGLAHSVNDRTLAAAAAALADARSSGGPVAPCRAYLAGLLRRRLNEQQVI